MTFFLPHSIPISSEILRALLADRLLESLSRVSVAQHGEWISESAERYEAYQQGKLQAVDGPEAIAVLREMFAK